MTETAAAQDKKRQERIVKTLLFGGVVALPLGIGIVNLVAFLVIAAQNPNDRVADDFYKKALAVHKNAEPNKLAVEQGISANVSYFASEGIVEIQLLGEYDAVSTLALDLVHGVDANQDQRLLLTSTAEGNFVGTFSGSLSRFTQLRLAPISVEQPWLLVKPATDLEQLQIGGQELWKVTL